jgi:hypothetical protein
LRRSEAFWDPTKDQEDQDESDGDIDPEDPLPRQSGNDDAAERRAGAMRARPVMPLKTPKARPRSCLGKVALKSAIASGMTSAAPAPCPARAVMSQATWWLGTA